jgi:hypothetical protein
MKKEAEIILIKGKKGSHVGMIISFMIFITFVIFVFVVLKPAINIGGGKQIILDDSESKILENISSNFSITSVSFGTVIKNRQCVSLQKILAILGIFPPYRMIVKNQGGITEAAYLATPIVVVEGVPTSDALAINRQDRTNSFFRIYQSPKFEGLTAGTGLTCDKVLYDDSIQEYSIGNIYSGTYAFEDSIRNLVEQYNLNYSATKENLKISPAEDFSFYVTLSNGSRIEANQPTSAKNIYAQETPLQYIDDNANIQSGYIVIKIW